jgi:hypothetical protein
LKNGNYRTGDTREEQQSAIEDQKTLYEDDKSVTSVLMSREVDVGPRIKSTTEASEYRTGGKSLVVLQLNCRRVYNKTIELWNLVETYNPDVIIGTESWLKEVLAMLRFLGLILQLTEAIGQPLVVRF